MARSYTAGVLITGNADGAVKATKLSRDELEKLNTTQKRGAAVAKEYASSIGSIVKASGLAVAAFASVGAAMLTNLVKSGLAAGDSLAKVSTKLNLNTQALAGYRIAAERTGVEQGKLDTAIAKLNINVGKAASIGGEAAKAFETLGLKAEDLAKLPTDQRLGVIADALNRVEGTAHRSALAAQIFGDEVGVSLLNTLKLGSDGLDEFRQKAEIAGTALTDVAANGIEQANDALDDLGLLWDGLGQQLAAQVAPVLTEIATRLFSVAEEAGGMGNVAETVFKNIVSGIATVVGWFENLIDVGRLAGVGFRIFGNLAEQALLRLAQLGTHLLENSVVLRWIFGVEAADISGNNAFVIERIGELEQELIDLGDRSRQIIGDMGSFSKRITEFVDEATRKSNEIAKAAIARNSEVIADGIAVVSAAEQKALEEQDKALEKLERGLMDYYARQELATIKAENKFADARVKAQEKAAEEVKRLNEQAAAEARRVWEQAAERIDTAFADAWKGAFDSFDDFSDRLKDAFKQLLAELAHQAITQPIVVQLTGALTGQQGAAASGVQGQAGQVLDYANLVKGVQSAYGTIFKSGGSTNPAIANANRQGLTTSLYGAAGAFVGRGIGNQISNRQPQQYNPFTTAGTIIGSYWGPWGAAIGGAIGGLLDKVTGKDVNGQRVALGVTAGGDFQIPDGFAQSVVGASGLKLTGHARRQDSNIAQGLLDQFVAIDAALTESARSLGLTIDFTGKTLTNVAQGAHAPGNFFGAFAKGQLPVDDVKIAADEFVKAWLNEINSQLSQRVRGIIGGVQQTADVLTEAFVLAGGIDQLLKLDVVRDTKKALEELGEGQLSLLEQYDRTVDKVLEVSGAYDGSIASLRSLTEALAEQKVTAAGLATLYHGLKDQIEGTFGSAISQIQESILSDEELYNLRRSQIADLTGQLSTTLDPEAISSLVSQIDSLSKSAFGILDEGQRRELADEFIGFLTEARLLANSRVEAGLSSLETRETSVNAAIDFELLNGAANTQAAAAQQFADAVAQFSSLFGNGIIQSSFIPDLSRFAEVNTR